MDTYGIASSPFRQIALFRRQIKVQIIGTGSSFGAAISTSAHVITTTTIEWQIDHSKVCVLTE